MSCWSHCHETFIRCKKGEQEMMFAGGEREKRLLLAFCEGEDSQRPDDMLEWETIFANQNNECHPFSLSISRYPFTFSLFYLHLILLLSS